MDGAGDLLLFQHNYWQFIRPVKLNLFCHFICSFKNNYELCRRNLTSVSSFVMFQVSSGVAVRYKGI